MLLVPLRPAVVDQTGPRTTRAPRTPVVPHLAPGRLAGGPLPRTWVLGFLVGIRAYHVVVLPAIFVIGPVLMQRDYDGARSWALITVFFGIGNILGDLPLLVWRPASRCESRP